MVAIFTNTCDESSINVCNWLHKMKIDFDLFSELNIGEKSQNSISITGNHVKSTITINNKGIDAAWIRKEPRRNFKYLYQKSLAEFVNSETRNYIKSIYAHLIRQDKVYLLGKYTYGYVAMNKLQMLELARACGLKIPAFLISNSRDKIQQFLEEYPKSICKAIGEGQIFSNEDKSFQMDMYGKLLTREIVENIDTSFPNYVQEYIEKQVELRIFVLEDKIYSSAIFTQEIEEAQIDFRPSTKALRIVPFQLPEDIESKILEFCKKANHNTGSIDMILDQDRNYVFLELNPCGQYDMVSSPCNYHLDREIAKTLKNGSQKT